MYLKDSLDNTMYFPGDNGVLCLISSSSRRLKTDIHVALAIGYLFAEGIL